MKHVRSVSPGKSTADIPRAPQARAKKIWAFWPLTLLKLLNFALKKSADSDILGLLQHQSILRTSKTCTRKQFCFVEWCLSQCDLLYVASAEGATKKMSFRSAFWSKELSTVDKSMQKLKVRQTYRLMNDSLLAHVPTEITAYTSRALRARSKKNWA